VLWSRNIGFKQATLEGRIYNTHLGVSYLSNEADKAGGLTRKASQFISAFGDINNLINPQNSLRFSIEQGDVNGIVKIDKNEAAALTYKTYNMDNPTEFTTRYRSINILVMQERGYFYGLEYTSYKMPSVLGFSDSSKNVAFVALDKDLGIKLYSLKGGYDSASYAKRYENNYSSFFIDGNLKLGLGWLSISDDVEAKAKSSGSYRTINAPLLVTIGGGLDVGYIHQMRIKTFGGLGMSLKGGYQVKGSWMGAGQSEKSEQIGAGELALEFDRYDIFHGPFVQASIVF
jgi:hypothetical protein